jgi:phenylacetate-CoA ligase
MKHPFVGNEYQVIVKKSISGDKILIKIESSRKLDRYEREAMVKKLQYELKENILVTPEIEIVDPGTLPRSEGKAKRIIIESEDI